eukprot:TRINITY_DN4988_c0_g1_i2.p4 TRINITY_DN4988_c0_g1~~TRINITY_DN4988_c0_g1_i2.p4  ORF type:complete len:160 (-),score=26.83 TRINITY_DN4988_c0_g1_i2:792-1271(-)
MIFNSNFLHNLLIKRRKSKNLKLMISQQYCKSKKKKKKKIKSGKKLLVEIQQIKDEYLLKANLNEHGDNTIYWKKFDLFSNLAQYVNEIHQYFDSETMWECDKCYPLAKQSLKQISDLKKLNEQESELDKKRVNRLTGDRRKKIVTTLKEFGRRRITCS